MSPARDLEGDAWVLLPISVSVRAVKAPRSPSWRCSLHSVSFDYVSGLIHCGDLAAVLPPGTALPRAPSAVGTRGTGRDRWHRVPGKVTVRLGGRWASWQSKSRGRAGGQDTPNIAEFGPLSSPFWGGTPHLFGLVDVVPAHEAVPAASSF